MTRKKYDIILAALNRARDKDYTPEEFVNSLEDCDGLHFDTVLLKAYDEGYDDATKKYKEE